MDLFNEVRLDFNGAGALATQMGRARTEAAGLRRELAAVTRDLRAVQLAGRMPELPAVREARLSRAADRARKEADDRDPYGGFKLGAAGAAGAGLFMRATSLANPQATSRFTDALDDLTAVIGHQLVPVLEEMTRWVRSLGDWFARHPTAAKVAATGITGLGVLGVGGLALAGARTAWGGIKWGLEGVGLRTSEAERAATAARASEGARVAQEAAAATRASQAAAEVRAARALDAARAAEKASGGLGASPEVARAAQVAEAELAAARAASSGAVPATEAGAAARIGLGGRLAGFGGKAMGFLGAAALPLTALFSAPEMYEGHVPDWISQNTPGYNLNAGGNDQAARLGLAWARRQLGFSDPNRVLRSSDIANLSPEQQERYGYRPGGMKLGQGGEPTSWGAAARPAQYQDIVGSVLALRQSIASGAGQDPAERTASAAESIQQDVAKLAGREPAAEGTDRGTGGSK